MSGERVLITGGQGFIGRYLAQSILDDDEGAEVISVGRSPEFPESFTHSITWKGVHLRAPLDPVLMRSLDRDRHSYRQVDLLDGSALSRVLRDVRPTMVFHLAGELRGGSTSRLLLNVEMVVRLMEELGKLEAGSGSVVIGSSGAVYGRRPPSRPRVSERSRPNPLDIYATTKLAVEHAAGVLARRYGLSLAIARIFNVVGPGQAERHIAGALGSQFVAIEKGLQPPTVSVGPLVTTRDFLDVRDVARALHLMARKGAEGIYNVASGRETPVQELYDTMLGQVDHEGDIQRQTLPDRRDDNPRVVVDTRRLGALEALPSISLAGSLRDILDYYRCIVEASHGRVGHARGARTRPSPARAGPLEVSGRADFGYAVEIEPGLLGELPVRLEKLLARHGRTFPKPSIGVLSDPTVHDLYGRSLIEELRARGCGAFDLRIAEGEPAKAFDSYLSLLRQMQASGFDRRSVLVALGGGVTLDVGGFVAASYMRGVAYVNVPTTLLAQADAAVGGKVAVNAPWAKNFVGAFHHPRAVYADPLVLKTLEPRQVAAGVAEAIKVAIIGDPKLFELLEANVDRIVETRDPTVLTQVVRRSLALKIELLAPDPYEHDLRRVLNFGHTIGHALETALGYEKILHGEAVAFGMGVATACAAGSGLIPQSDADRIIGLIRSFGMCEPISFDVAASALEHLDAIRRVRGGRLNFVLPEAIGRVRIVDDIDPGGLLQGISRTVGLLH